MPDAPGKHTLRHDLARLGEFESLTPDVLRAAYREACMARMHVERVVQECLKGTVKFAIWGPGEEIHGTAAALALHEVVNPDAFAICGHYRSASLLAMWSRLRGYDDFHLDHMRQQLSKATDPWSAGRQMTAHFNDMRFNTLPVQSALGMQVSKSVGYAQGLRLKGATDGVVKAVIGDGTCAEGDLHEGMTAASILALPWLLTITDNNVAISVEPEDGRGIDDFESYAKAFGFAYFSCDGNDFLDVFDVTRRAATYCRDAQKPALLWVRNLSRLNDHSSAADVTFKFEQFDPLIDFGEALVHRGILSAEDIVRRKDGSSKDYFARHDLGAIGGEADAHIVETMEVAGAEPEPTPQSIYEHIRDPYPPADEPPPQGRTTVISLNGAMRAAMRAILRDNPMTWLYGQDVGKKGGVMQATRGLVDEFPKQVRDAPINEPLILGTAVGFALHEGRDGVARDPVQRLQPQHAALAGVPGQPAVDVRRLSAGERDRAAARGAAARGRGVPLDVHGGLLRGDPRADDLRAHDVARPVRPAALGGGLLGPGGVLRVEGPVPDGARRCIPGRADRQAGGREAQAGDRVRGIRPRLARRLPRAAGQGGGAARGNGPHDRDVGTLHPVLRRGGGQARRGGG